MNDEKTKKELWNTVDVWLSACESFADIKIPDKREICNFLTLEIFDKLQTAKREVAKEIFMVYKNGTFSSSALAVVFEKYLGEKE